MFTPKPAILESRQQQIPGRLAHACCNKLKELNQNASCGAPICRVGKKHHENGRTPWVINWVIPGEESVVSTIMLDDTTSAKSFKQHMPREQEAKIVAGVRMWSIAGLHSDNHWVGAATVCKHSIQYRFGFSFPVPEYTEVFYTELWLFAVGLDMAIENESSVSNGCS
jgi:hypothetical protein